jgi:hypothetical protein
MAKKHEKNVKNFIINANLSVKLVSNEEELESLLNENDKALKFYKFDLIILILNASLSKSKSN